MPAPLGSPIFQWFTPAGAPAAGYRVYSYAAGTSTPLATYPTSADASAGTSPLSNPVILDAAGRAAIWLTDALYKIVIKSDLDVLQYTIDNVTGSIGGATGTSGGEWFPSGLNPTYISATTFTVPGDHSSTGEFEVGRRLLTTNTAGQVAGTSVSAVFSGGVTTVTVANDSGALDSGLSSVLIGIISSPGFKSSLPKATDVVFLFSTTTPVTSGVAAQGTISGVVNDVLGEITSGANGYFSPKVAGTYLIGGYIEVDSSGTTTGIAGTPQQATVTVNAVAGQALGKLSWPYADSLARSGTFPIAGYVALSVGQQFQARVTCNWATNAPTFSGAVTIRKIL